MATMIGDPINLTTEYGVFKAYHVKSASESDNKLMEGVALSSLRTKVGTTPILVRVQSSCVFSESFHSHDCDCALQLSTAAKLISLGEGLIIYQYDEGRGMGLESKFKAIRLQQLHGIDSKAACRALSIDVDSRSYAGVADVVGFLAGDRPIVLLSNNPAKERSLREQGLRIFARHRLLCTTNNPLIVEYLNEKRRTFGHDIPDL